MLYVARQPILNFQFFTFNFPLSTFLTSCGAKRKRRNAERMSDSTSAMPHESQMPSMPISDGSSHTQASSNTRVRVNAAAALTTPLLSPVNNAETNMFHPLMKNASM